jgi:integrase
MADLGPDQERGVADKPPALPALAAASAEVTRLAAAAAEYADAARASSTRRAYQSSWRAFTSWCEAHHARTELPIDAAIVAFWLIDLAPGRSVATLSRHLAAIRAIHADAGQPPPASPALTKIWTGIRHKHSREPRQARPLTTKDLRAVIKRLPADVSGLRDKALLLLAFAGALRRSELVALELEGDAGIYAVCRCRFVAGGLHIRLGKSKGDQEGRGQTIAIPFGKTDLCPVAALRAWLDAARISAGPIFRQVDRHGRVGAAALTDGSVARIIKRAVGRTGMAPDLFSGHSPRAGFVTQAAGAGVSTELIMRQTRHKKAETVAIYVREASLFDRNAASKVGL